MDQVIRQLRPRQGRPAPARQFSGPQPATVLGPGAAGRLRVELDALRGAAHQARWSSPSIGATPPAGTRCLVLFSDRGVGEAWIVTFDRWPA